MTEAARPPTAAAPHPEPPEPAPGAPPAGPDRPDRTAGLLATTEPAGQPTAATPRPAPRGPRTAAPNLALATGPADHRIGTRPDPLRDGPPATGPSPAPARAAHRHRAVALTRPTATTGPIDVPRKIPTAGPGDRRAGTGHLIGAGHKIDVPVHLASAIGPRPQGGPALRTEAVGRPEIGIPAPIAPLTRPGTTRTVARCATGPDATNPDAIRRGARRRQGIARPRAGATNLSPGERGPESTPGGEAWPAKERVLWLTRHPGVRPPPTSGATPFSGPATNRSVRTAPGSPMRCGSRSPASTMRCRPGRLAPDPAPPGRRDRPPAHEIWPRAGMVWHRRAGAAARCRGR
jgi:hypothetical protein